MPEIFVGPKFRTIFASRETPHDDRLDEFISWTRRLTKMGVIAKAMGNLSFRTASGFIITPSGTDPATITAGQFVEVTSVDMERREITVNGPADPSSESMIHAAIYRNRADVNAIFHGHNNDFVATAETRGIPVTAREQSYGTPQLVAEVVGILGNHFFVVMRNHGFIAMGRTIGEAGAQIEKIFPAA